MRSNSKPLPPWAWVAAATFAVVVGFNCLRSSVKQEADKQVKEFLQQEYGEAVRQYRADPLGFRARLQQQVQHGEIRQQDADQVMTMVENLSRKLP